MFPIAFLMLVAGTSPSLSETLLNRMPQDFGNTRLVIPDADPAFRALEEAWNQNDADAFRARLEAVEASGKTVPEFGLEYLHPRPHARLNVNGGPIPVSDSQGIREVELVVDPTSGTMLAFLASDSSNDVITLMSTDGGNTWVETYSWHGASTYKIDAFFAEVSGTTYAYLADIYVPTYARLRRFPMNTGVYDTAFGNPQVFQATDTLTELSAFTSSSYILGYFLYLHSGGTVDYYFSSLSTPSFSSFPTGVTNAAKGLSGTDVSGQIGPVLFAYTNATRDTLFVRWRKSGGSYFGGTHFTGTDIASVRQTAVAAQADTVIVVYDYYNSDSAAYYVKYRIMYGDTGTFYYGSIATSGESQGYPRAIQQNGTFAVSWINVGAEPDSIVYRTRPVNGPWNPTWSFPYDYFSPVTDHDLVQMGGGAYGFLAVDGGMGYTAIFMASTWTDVAEPVENNPIAGVRLDRTLVRRGGMLSLTFPTREQVRITLLSVDGRRQGVVFEGQARTTLGLRAPTRAGIYFLQIQSPRRTETRRFVVIP